MSESLGTLTAKLGLDTADLQKGVQKATGDLKSLEGSGSDIGDSFVKAGGIAAAAIGAIGLAAGAFALKSVDEFKKVGSEVNELTRFTGESAESMSVLRFAALQSGVGAETLAKTIEVLSLNLAKGGSELRELGIATTDASGRMLPAKAVLFAIADQFQSMPNGIRKTQIAYTAFGKSGDDLIPMLNKGRAGLEALEKQAAKYGLVLTKDNIVAMKAATEASRNQDAAMSGLQVQIGANVLPAVTKLTLAMTDGLVTVMPAVSGIIDGAVLPALGALTTVLGATLRFVEAHPGPVKVLAAVVGAALVPALVAWAAAQAAAAATSIVSFVLGLAVQAQAAAVSLRLMTGSMQAGTVAATGLGASVAGVTAVLGVLFVEWNRQKSAAADWSQKLVSAATSPEAAISSLREAQAKYKAEMSGGLNVLGLHIFAQDKDAKAAAVAKQRYDAVTKTLGELEPAIQKSGGAAEQIAEEFNRSTQAADILGGQLRLTADKVSELAGVMKIDLATATSEQKTALIAVAERLQIASPATLKLADANKVLSDWTKDATAKSAALSDALEQVVGVKVKSAQLERDLAQAQSALQRLGIERAEKLAAANRDILDSVRALTSATRDRQDAEEALQELLNPDADTKEDAQLALTEADLKVKQTLNAIEQAKRDSDKADGRVTPVEKADLVMQIAEAENAHRQAIEDREDAQRAVNALTPEGIRASKEYRDVTRTLADVTQREADARQAVTSAQSTARQIEQEQIGRQDELAEKTEAVVTATVAQAEAVYRATGSMSAAQGVFSTHIGNLRDTLGMLGLNKEEVDRLIGKYGLLPPQLSTIVGMVDNATAPLMRLRGLVEQLKADFGNVLLNVNVATSSAVTGPSYRPPPVNGAISGSVSALGFAAGGIIRSPQFAMLGEGYKPEVVLPLSDPARMRQLIDEAGIGGMFSGGYQPGTAGQSNTQNVTLKVDAPMDAGLVRQAEYAARVAGWRLGSSGRR